jgi:hypothetical protein
MPPDAPTMLRWARSRLSEIPEVPQPWNITEFVRRVAANRQRPIELIPRTMSHYASVATGLWVRRADRDQIVFDSSGAELHQDHIILHELAHILCGHEGIAIKASPPSTPPQTLAGRGSLDDDALITALAAAQGEDEGAADEPTRVLHRSAYDSRQELEAETLAFVIWQAAGLRMVPGISPITRVAGAFEHNHRH